VNLPSLDIERALAREHGVRFVIGVDEVGRGSIAGPVAVGAALIDLESAADWPSELRDSKLMSEKARERNFPLVQDWVIASGVGMTPASRIETDGIVRSLELAGGVAIGELLSALSVDRAALATEGCLVLLDGSHNWLGGSAFGLKVVTKTKADRDCVAVACASVLAKVERDRLMIALDEQLPQFGFAGNKGYASAGHIDALRAVGPSAEHRLSWLTKILAGETEVSAE
jgi:ribonuclease HII